MPTSSFTDWNPHGLAACIGQWAQELGFQATGISGINLGATEARLLAWLEQGCHGEMAFMASHGVKRCRPAELVPGTVTVICVRMDYLPARARNCHEVLGNGDMAYVSRYALGRDYHKVLRARLQTLADKIQAVIGPFGYRVFTDSAPVMEVELASRAGLGWRGKHNLLLSREHGSWFFLGELYTDLPLPTASPVTGHCGTCRRCLDSCPTGAITAPYHVDARSCISYLTIEHKGSIPMELRTLIGNRIYGCDDCQLVCPWNRSARSSLERDFEVRHGLDEADLISIFAWEEAEFRRKMAGSPILRIGYDRWQRNIAVALGNAPTSPATVAALAGRIGNSTPLVREHITWALARHGQSCDD